MTTQSPTATAATMPTTTPDLRAVAPKEMSDAARAIAVARKTRDPADIEHEAEIYEEHVTDRGRVLAEEGPQLGKELDQGDTTDDLDEFEPLEPFDPDADPGEAIAAADDPAWYSSLTKVDCAHPRARLVDTRGYTDTDTVRLCYHCPDCSASFEREVLPNDPEIQPPWT